MKREISLAQIWRSWQLLSLTLFAACIPTWAQTNQPIVPFVDEIIVNPQAQRATAYFGYADPNTRSLTLPIGLNNFFFPTPQDRGQPTVVSPGTNHYVFAVVFDYSEQPTISWVLDGTPATADPASAGADTPQTSVFTYQGRLTDSGAPANGTYQLRFTLFGTITNGTPIGPPIEVTNVVTNGRFTAPLDFGSDPFINGASRFLQIEVSPGGGATYTTLSPRQQLTSAPYASRAFSAATADTATSALQLNGTPANLFVQTSDPRLSGTIGQSVNTVYGTGTLVVNSSITNYTLVPGLSQTINVPANSILLVSTDGGIQSTGTTANSFSAVDIGIFVDGVVSSSAGQRRVTVLNGSGIALLGNWSMTVTRELTAGNHLFEVKAVNAASGTSPANVSSASAPQVQGQLTITVLKK